MSKLNPPKIIQSLYAVSGLIVGTISLIVPFSLLFQAYYYSSNYDISVFGDWVFVLVFGSLFTFFFGFSIFIIYSTLSISITKSLKGKFLAGWVLQDSSWNEFRDSYVAKDQIFSFYATILVFILMLVLGYYLDMKGMLVIGVLLLITTIIQYMYQSKHQIKDYGIFLLKQDKLIINNYVFPFDTYQHKLVDIQIEESEMPKLHISYRSTRNFQSGIVRNFYCPIPMDKASEFKNLASEIKACHRKSEVGEHFKVDCIGDRINKSKIESPTRNFLLYFLVAFAYTIFAAYFLYDAKLDEIRKTESLANKTNVEAINSIIERNNKIYSLLPEYSKDLRAFLNFVSINDLDSINSKSKILTFDDNYAIFTEMSNEILVQFYEPNGNKGKLVKLEKRYGDCYFEPIEIYSSQNRLVLVSKYQWMGEIQLNVRVLDTKTQKISSISFKYQNSGDYSRLKTFETSNTLSFLAFNETKKEYRVISVDLTKLSYHEFSLSDKLGSSVVFDNTLPNIFANDNRIFAYSDGNLKQFELNGMLKNEIAIGMEQFWYHKALAIGENTIINSSKIQLANEDFPFLEFSPIILENKKLLSSNQTMLFNKFDDNMNFLGSKSYKSVNHSLLKSFIVENKILFVGTSQTYMNEFTKIFISSYETTTSKYEEDYLGIKNSSIMVLDSEVFNDQLLILLINKGISTKEYKISLLKLKI